MMPPLIKVILLMLLMSENHGHYLDQALIIGALLATLLSAVVILLLASRIIEFLGHTVANAVTRILGVILAALATQYMFDGIRTAFFAA